MDSRARTEASAEAAILLDVLRRRLPRHMDGRRAIEEMREANHHWRQMEWIGWYVEWIVRKLLEEEARGSKGPTYGRTSFDYQRRYPWDIKAHPVSARGGAAILNDQEAIEACIEDHGGIGFLIISGTAAYDEPQGSFKAWHDALKGGTSRYEAERIRRGAPSRRRKTAFQPRRVEALFLESMEELRQAVAEGILRGFQEGMRNANGQPRRAKYALRTSAPREWMRAAPPVDLAQGP